MTDAARLLAASEQAAHNVLNALHGRSGFDGLLDALVEGIQRKIEADLTDVIQRTFVMEGL